MNQPIPVVQLALPLPLPLPRPTRDQRRANGEAWLKILYALLTPVGEHLPRSGDTGGAPCSTR